MHGDGPIRAVANRPDADIEKDCSTVRLASTKRFVDD